ncbi:DUF1273 domain-containing protein [Enterococcus timonensis]|uniref:DUF1273 domain-containing protein n=1 Tax=Enterococcus timonensis TaxID=1852364 RepID=UPI0008D8DFCE|nr:DUF1273 domain-containing protein [Enterococcus timonensis]
MKNLYVSGYRSFELSIFQENDPKITRIKEVLKSNLKEQLEEGLEWVIISGNLGVEQWTASVVTGLKEEYPELKLGIIYPFKDFGSQWKENNQEKKIAVEAQADFVDSVSHAPYQNPGQLKNHTQFLLQHTDGAILVYDDEFPGKTEFFYKEALKQENYQLSTISFDDLQNFESY